jgi:hypothetical protein
MRTIRIFQAVIGQVLAKLFKAFHLKSQMRQIGLDLNRPAGREIAKLNQFLAAGGFHENQFGPARRFMAAGFFQAQNVFVEFDRFFEVVDAIARMQKFGSLAHALTIARNWAMTTGNDGQVPLGSDRRTSPTGQSGNWTITKK